MKHSYRKARRITTWAVALALILQMGFATTVMASSVDYEEPDGSKVEAADGISADASQIPEEPAEVEAATVTYEVTYDTKEADSMLDLVNELRSGNTEVVRSEDVEEPAEEEAAEEPEEEPEAEEPAGDENAGEGSEEDAGEGADEEPGEGEPSEEEPGEAQPEEEPADETPAQESQPVVESGPVITVPDGLQEYVYDEDLEAIAKQRAAEIAVYFSHTRPDGEETWSAYTECQKENEKFSVTAAGENIAWGSDSAEDILDVWAQEEGGNLSNLFSYDYNAVGIACVSFNGTGFWVMEFAKVDQAALETEPGPEEEAETGTGDGPASGSTEVTVKVADSVVTVADLTINPVEYSMSAGGTDGVPTASGVFTTKETRPEQTVCAINEVSADWSAADPSIVQVEGDEVTALAAGETTLEATILGEAFEAPVAVAQSIEDCAFTFDPESGVYDGGEQIPVLTVTNGDLTLKPDEDYTVAYSDNLNAGDASVTVTGVGNYSGEVTLEYPIAQREVTPEISGTTTKVYDGTAEAPDDLVIELSGVIDGEEVTAEAESFEYNSADAADATTITASGITLSGGNADNYKLTSDTAETEGTITKVEAELAFKSDLDLDKTYDGEEEPDPTIDDLEDTEVPEEDIVLEWCAGDPDSGNIVPAPADAGSYNLVARVVEESNYTAEEAVLPVTIAKADSEPEEQEVTVTAGKAEKGITVDIADLIEEGGEAGTPEVGGKDEELIDGDPEIKDDEVTFDVTAQDDGAEAIITVPVTGCVNYNDYEITISVTAVGDDTETEPGPETGGSDEPDTETEPGPETGKTDEPNPETETEPGPVEDEDDEPNPKTETEAGPVEDEDDEPNPETETEAGPVENEDEEPNPETETEPGPVTNEPTAVNEIKILGSSTMLYDGEEADVEIEADYGESTATYTWRDVSGEVLDEAPTDAGTYTVEVEIEGTPEYESAVAEEEYVIDPATPKVTLEDKEAVYTGEVITVDEAKVKLVGADTYDGDITYNYYKDEACLQKMSVAPTDVGTYYAVASIPAFENYTSAKSNVATLSIIGQPSEGGIGGDGTDGIGGGTTVGSTHSGLSVPMIIFIIAICVVAAVIIVLLYLRRRDMKNEE